MKIRFALVGLVLTLVSSACDPKVEPKLCATGVSTVCADLEDCVCPPPESSAIAVQILYQEAIESDAHSAIVTVRGPCTSNTIEVPVVDRKLRIVRPLPMGAGCFFSVAVESLGTTTSTQFADGQCDEIAVECVEGAMDASMDAASPDAGGM